MQLKISLPNRQLFIADILCVPRRTGEIIIIYERLSHTRFVTEPDQFHETEKICYKTHLFGMEKIPDMY